MLSFCTLNLNSKVGDSVTVKVAAQIERIYSSIDLKLGFRPQAFSQFIGNIELVYATHLVRRSRLSEQGPRNPNNQRE